MSGLWSAGLPPSSLWLRSAYSLSPFPLEILLIATWDQQLFSPPTPAQVSRNLWSPWLCYAPLRCIAHHWQADTVKWTLYTRPRPLLPRVGLCFFPLWTHPPCLRTCHPHLTRLVPQFPGKGGKQLSVSCSWGETEMNGCGFAVDACLAWTLCTHWLSAWSSQWLASRHIASSSWNQGY